MKRILSLLLTIIMMLSIAAVSFAEEGAPANGDEDTATLEENIWFPPDPEVVAGLITQTHLNVGTLTAMSGYFFTDMWGNNTADIDVRALLHGYGTVAWSRNGNIDVDYTVVTDISATDDEDQNRTYTFTIADDLTYNDGTPITAADYVFSVLFAASPAVEEIGAVPTTMQHYTGYEEYIAGEPYSGVRLLGDYTFSLTISAENLPYYYELALVDVLPYPISVIAPEAQVLDDGGGAYIDGEFTAELLAQTVTNPEDGYLFFPTITTGPFALVSYDAQTHSAAFVKNQYYKGNFEGQVPYFDTLVYKYVDPETMYDQLLAGEIDLINKVSDGTLINTALTEYVNAEEQKMLAQTYLRSGLSFLSFATEMGVTQYPAVRKAINLSIDKAGYTEEFTMGYGMQVFGYYGLGQWMADSDQERLLELAMYEKDIVAANNILDEDGWTLNADGTEYDAAAGGVRHRENEEGELEELAIKWARPEGTAAADLMEEMLVEALPQIGMRLEVEKLPFDEMLKNYYRQEQREYNMFFLATNFHLLFDPYYSFSNEEVFQGIFNTTGIDDEELLNLADTMRRTAPGEDEAYSQRWFDMQKRWVEVLPMVPLYSNTYFDFYRTDLQEYFANANWSWGTAVLYAYIGEPVPAPEPEVIN